MGIFNRWASKKENDEAKEKRAASVIKKAQEIKKEEVKEEKKQEAKVVKEVKKPAKAVAPEQEVASLDAHKVLVRPVVTEKSTYLQTNGAYVFEVFPDVTKIEVKKAVQSLYKVKVKGVRIVNLKGKQVRFGRVAGTRKNRKKAIVTLQKGQAIELHKNV